MPLLPDADPVTLRQWYPLGMEEDVTTDGIVTLLLGEEIALSRAPDGTIRAMWGDRPLTALLRYGYVWTSFLSDGTGHDLVPVIEEAMEDDRRLVCCGSVMVRASALRVVENFLDMAHFPFVHTDILGAEPRTEVERYSVETRKDGQEIWAVECRFFQPQAALSADGGLMVDYIYRIASPFSTLLYKTCPEQPGRKDVIALFVQPMTQETCRAHPVMFLLDGNSDRDALVAFQQMIFLQDRTILENHRPEAMPLDSSSEISTLSDRSSVAYRRWLRAQGVTFGASRPEHRDRGDMIGASRPARHDGRGA
ncbi:aromatic ring-hydroxylating oxygenase subunit alpha [Swaminathania salitolerans]|uniref:(2Fe-2S)-binding protein n=1 Tax=Swaminathania salitolerans TaxID=182838 RepID=A0A511BN01_9PROT|nr:aromatic ring-hydroxylating dioxygenase subunit alpha [Swaminathania salitolerans]GBQ13846.1 vanillate O-demethylase oxygenase [Swaminathania salitolerans LMG 21291]GEL01716.1 (2Fe-2S)-binding protein [Swaminathania salitolerans]